MVDWSLAAGLLLQEMDARKARKAAGAETPAEITADGFVTVPPAKCRGGSDRPLSNREDDMSQDRAEALPVRIEYGAARRRPDGGFSSRLRPATQVAANDDGPVHATPAMAKPNQANLQAR